MAKEKKDKSSLRVSPTKKKKDDKKDIKSKAHQLIIKHPEVLYNARALFRNENGKTIVEEAVPRGDPDQEEVIMPRNQGDLKDEDLRDLAVFALKLIDATLKEYDPQVAMEDALARAIATKDNGKYAGKVNASTFALILESMNKKAKKAAEEPKPEVISEKSKEATVDKETILKEIEVTQKKLDALKVLAECAEEKKEEKEEEKKEDDKKEGEESSKSITASLDEIAEILEEQKDPELLKVAFQLDMISDVLEGKKEASCLEGDADEKYMKEYFKAGLREGDSDEKDYMDEFNTDISTELRNKYTKGLDKDASEKLPYQIKK